MRLPVQGLRSPRRPLRSRPALVASTDRLKYRLIGTNDNVLQLETSDCVNERRPRDENCKRVGLTRSSFSSCTVAFAFAIFLINVALLAQHFALWPASLLYMWRYGAYSVFFRGSEAAAAHAAAVAEICDGYNYLRSDIVEQSARVNQRRAPPELDRCTVIVNATLWDGKVSVKKFAPLSHIVVLREGLIYGISANGSAEVSDYSMRWALETQCVGYPKGQVDIINAMGRIVTPGLVDMHNHAGLVPWPYLRGSDDVNEIGSPTVPGARVIDAFDSKDIGIKNILAGGVTTILVLPGSANLVGGEAVAFKTMQPDSGLAEDMQVQANLTRENVGQTGGEYRRWMKFACGENAIRTYSTGNNYRSRMGNALLLRSKLEEARKLKSKQDNWCMHPYADISEPPPYASAQIEPLVALLRGAVSVQWHCYLTSDIATQLRVAKEFNFSVSAFHHALDLFSAPNVLLRGTPATPATQPIGAALFIDNWGYKREATFSTPYAASQLLARGVPVALKSDHPVTNAQYLRYQAARGLHYGLSETDALRAITSTPAKLIGLDHRIGALRQGMDADVVIWNSERSIFDIGAMPWRVYVDGKSALVNENALKVDIPRKGASSQHPSYHSSTFNFASARSRALRVPSDNLSNNKTLRLTGISRIIRPGQDDIADGAGASRNKRYEIQIDIHTGLIKHVGPENAKELPNASGMGIYTFDLSGATVAPVFVSAGTVLGTLDINQEPESGDGGAINSAVREGEFSPTMRRAADALISGSKMVADAALGGVGLSISITPISLGQQDTELPMSESVLFACNGDVDNEVPFIEQKVVALHVDLEPAGDGCAQCWPFSKRLAVLRNMLMQHKARPLANHSSISLVAHGQMPLVLNVDMASRIAASVRMVREVDSSFDLGLTRLIVAGASESHMVANDLALAKISGVILTEALCQPSAFNKRNCIGVLDKEMHVARVLKAHGIKFALSSGRRNLSFIKNLRWDVKWMQVLAGLTDSEAIAAMSTNVLEMFGVDVSRFLAIKPGSLGYLNIFTGDPKAIGTRLLGYVSPRSRRVFFSSESESK